MHRSQKCCSKLAELTVGDRGWHTVVSEVPLSRNVTNSESKYESESNDIRHFFRNPTSIGYLKSVSDSKFLLKSNSTIIFIKNK